MRASWHIKNDRIVRTIAAALIACVASGSIAHAASTLPPQTKIRISIIQWIPTLGAYQRWDAIGGEFTVSDDWTVSLPVMGRLTVKELDEAGLASAIAKQLQRKIGLNDVPEATVEIVEYPPIYIVGDVDKPGEYKYREGMTALQSLALGGGVFRRKDGPPLADRLGYVNQLKDIGNSIIRSEIRLARLEAERASSTDITYDTQIQSDPALAKAVLANEKALFTARRKELERQSKSLVDLQTLLSSEIENLEKKVKSTDEDVDAMQTQLGKIKGLVDKGALIPGRQLEIERLLRSYFADRLDLETSIMRARQNLAETTRNIDGLYDRQTTEIATSLQSEEASLDQLRLKRNLTQSLLVNAMQEEQDTTQTEDVVHTAFSITRNENGETREMPASGSTALRPGDVLHIQRKPEVVEAAAAPDANMPDAPRIVSQRADH